MVFATAMKIFIRKFHALNNLNTLANLSQLISNLCYVCATEQRCTDHQIVQSRSKQYFTKVYKYLLIDKSYKDG